MDHSFRYRLYMAYLDLAEIPQLFPRRSWRTIDFVRRDHLRQSTGPLEQAVRDLVKQETGMLLGGPIRLLTQLRQFGYYFSPLNLFYCFDPSGEEVQCVVAEVNNTPWGEQHCYVLWEGNRNESSSALRFHHDKSFHVSPFMSMDLHYDWLLTAPEEDLSVEIDTRRKGKQQFSARLQLSRRPLSNGNLLKMQLRHPLMTAKITAAIYFQALKLWWKKCPFYPHPKKSEIIPVR